MWFFHGFLNVFLGFLGGSKVLKDFLTVFKGLTH